MTGEAEKPLCVETIAIERAAVMAYAADHRRRIETQIAKGRLTADEGTLIAKQVDVFAEGVAAGLHMGIMEPKPIRAAVRAALGAAGLDGRPKSAAAPAELPPVTVSGRAPPHETSRGEAEPLEGRRMETRHGMIRLADAPGLTSISVDHKDPTRSRVGLILYRPAAPGEELGFGMIGQLDANQARSFAASFLRLANKLDGGARG